MFTNIHRGIIIIIKIVNLKRHIIQISQKIIKQRNDHSCPLFSAGSSNTQLSSYVF